MPNEVPLWVLRNIAYPAGIRYSKMTKFERKVESFATECCQCHKEFKGEARIRINGYTYCAPCQKMLADRYSKAVPNSGYQLPASSLAIVRVPIAGNLQETEYQFWIGCKIDYAKSAKCRVCRHVALSKEERKTHTEGQKYPACTTIMCLALKTLRAKSKCLVCGEHTTRQRWSVPLCCLGCIERYKFDMETRYVPQELELMHIRSVHHIEPPNDRVTLISGGWDE